MKKSRVLWTSMAVAAALLLPGSALLTRAKENVTTVRSGTIQREVTARADHFDVTARVEKAGHAFAEQKVVRRKDHPDRHWRR